MSISRGETVSVFYKRYLYVHMNARTFTRSRVIRFSILHIILEIKNCIGNSDYNDKVIMTLIITPIVFVHA